MNRGIIIATAFVLCISACTEKSGPLANKSTANGSMANGSTANRSPQPDATSEADTAILVRTGSPDGARVFFITPRDGDTVANPVRIEFGIEGMAIVRAGENQPNSGHHHLLIDTDLPDLQAPIPADANHVHFGDGSTSTEITLEPGQHTLCMILGDHLHIPHDPPLVSNSITITVE